MKKRRLLVMLGLVLLAGAVLALCQAPLQSWRTLISLKQIDDYPLYVMHYYGDYGFTAYLRRGVRPPQARDVPDGAAHGWACTTFWGTTPGGEAVLGRNFDWRNRQTLLLFTDPPDGYASVSMVDVSYLGFPSADPSWADRSRLLQAPWLPFDGMNERGLAVGMMAVSHARDDASRPRVTIDSLEAIRLLLDYAADVEEALALLDDYTVDFGGGPPIHYLIADRTGHSAVVEYLDGKMTALRAKQPWQVSTNFILAEEKPAGADSSCWRYNHVWERLAGSGGRIGEDEAMALLQEVSQQITIWSVVYNMDSGAIDVAMGRDYGQVHHLNLRMRQD